MTRRWRMRVFVFVRVFVCVCVRVYVYVCACVSACMCVSVLRACMLRQGHRADATTLVIDYGTSQTTMRERRATGSRERRTR